MSNPTAMQVDQIDGEKLSDRDSIYRLDMDELNEVRQSKPWQQDPKYFKNVSVSPSALMKMLIHANSGVDKGMSSQGGKPVEVMGLLLGRPATNPSSKHTLIVTDVYPLPVEGAETKVLADDAEVINYMISLGESLEMTRQERFMGWYHSHPFDVDVHNHCFLSSTDVSTQLQWQRAEDPHGNPWLAIVIDPLRSLAKGRPEIEAFRVYPPEFTAPLNETPDGKIVSDEKLRLEKWGSCWNRYYTLKIDYFMSSLGSQMVGILSEKFLWMQMLGSTPMLERENKERVSERVMSLAQKLSTCENQLGVRSLSFSKKSEPGSKPISFSESRTSTSSSNASSSAPSPTALPSILRKEDSMLQKSSLTSSDLSIEQCQGQSTQIVKHILFNQSCSTDYSSSQ